MNLAIPDIFFVLGFLGLAVWEIATPNVKYRFDRYWYIRLGVLLVLSVGLTQVLNPLLQTLISDHILLGGFHSYLSTQAPILNGFLIYLIYTFINYWWHRARHSSHFLWRTFHQVHHSTHELKTWTAFYSHPFDYFSTILIINLLCSWVVGLDATSAAWATVISGFFEVWEHTNIRTPQWLGYFIVRPEMHRVHHEIHHHSKNYSIPIWDMLFGTYENSKRTVVCGFEEDLETHLKDMLLCKDVHQH